MIVFGICSIIVAIFLYIAFILLIKENKGNLNSVKRYLILYSISGTILLAFGVLGMFDFFYYWQPICIIILIITLLALFIIITISEKKGKKVIKLKAKKINKKKVLVDKNDNIYNDNSDNKN